MVGQRATGLPEKVQTDGCYFMSLIRLCWEHGPYYKTVTLAMVNDLYRTFVDFEWMDEDCFIHDPQKIVDFIVPGKLHFLGKRDADYTLYSDEQAIELWRLEREPPKKWWYHFCYGAYDPWVRSITRATGVLDSLRVFKAI